MGSDDPRLHYETIETRARPARVAVLTNSSDADWRHTALRIIEVLSSLWGGKHSLIIPTDGLTIEPVFWTILEKFSPDFVFQYAKTGDDIWLSRPAEYAAGLDKVLKQYESDNTITASDHEREQIDRELRTGWADSFSLSSELCSLIADRLVPFHFESNFERLTLHHMPDQLTSIADVLPYVDHSDGMRRPVSETGCDKLPKVRLRRGRGDRL